MTTDIRDSEQMDISESNMIVAEDTIEEEQSSGDYDYSPHRAWYVIHTFSGYENKVKADLEKKVKSQNINGLSGRVFDVVVPMRVESEFKDGKRRNVNKKLIPGYVMLDMIVDKNSWFHVRNTHGVTGFVGSGKEPIPLTREEAERLLVELAESTPEEASFGFAVNDPVRIVSGFFENRVGTIMSINVDKMRVKVLVGNSSVDLDVSEVEKM